MLRVLRAEFLKLRRAKVVLGTMGVVGFFAILTGWIAPTWDPSAQVTWSSILASGPMLMAGWWGILLLSLAAAHLFGAEFSESTATSMLTTPIRREYFVAAKFVVLVAWALALVFASVGTHALVAIVRGADGFAWRLIGESLRDTAKVAMLVFLTLPTVAFISILGRGYLAPMMFATAMMTMSWACGFLGWSRWFPWAMPATVAGGLGPPDLLQSTLGPGSWAITLGLFAAGLVAVFVYVNRIGDAR